MAEQNSEAAVDKLMQQDSFYDEEVDDYEEVSYHFPVYLLR